jgi:hypothetical protein
MTSLIILALYLIIITLFIAITAFIAYHLKKYSLNAPINNFLLPFFLIVSALLLFSNLLLFSSVRWRDLLLMMPV